PPKDHGGGGGAGGGGGVGGGGGGNGPWGAGGGARGGARRSAAARGHSVRRDGQRLQGQVVGPQRADVEAVYPVTHAVSVRAVVDDQVRRLGVHDLLDLVVHLLALGRVELGPGLVDQLGRLGAAPVAVE